MTFGERLDKYKGIGPGFDHARVGLSLSILIWHGFALTDGEQWISEVPVWVFAVLSTLLPMFFGLSGFLIMGSALRTQDVRTFVAFRLLRIFPALSVEISLSAIILGAALTTLSSYEYFTNKNFFGYFGSLIGNIQYWLPGVFTDNPVDTVNGALWTVGPEIICYCIAAALMTLGHFTVNRSMVAALLAGIFICVYTDAWDPGWNKVHLPAKSLIISFISGNLIFLFRNRIVYSWPLFILISVFCVLLFQLSGQYLVFRSWTYIGAVLMPYCVVMVGLTQFRPLPFFRRGDYSYGLYIYHTPIQQTIIHLFPNYRSGWLVTPISLLITILLAKLSWDFIEKPALSLRKMVKYKSDLSEEKLYPFRKFIVILLIVCYGMYVTYCARLFPFHSMYDSLNGSYGFQPTNSQTDKYKDQLIRREPIF